MACALGLPSGSLLRPRLDKHPLQPLGLVKWSLRPGGCPLCIRCKAQAQSTEVSANDGTKKNSTWTHADPFASSEPYAGWDALDAKPEGDYWTGVLQIGAGVALAVGFALVSHAAYARRGGSTEAASPAAVQDVLPAQGTESGAQSSSPGKNSAGLVSPQPELVDAEVEGGDAEQGQQTRAEGAELHVEEEKTQQKATPELQPIATNEVDQFVLTSSELPESASEALPAEPEKFTDVTEEDAVVALPAAGSALAKDVGSGLSSSSEVQLVLPFEPGPVIIFSTASAELPSESLLEDHVPNSVSAEAASEPLFERDPSSHPVAVTGNSANDQALATLSLPALPEIAQTVTFLVVSSEGEEIGRAIRIEEPSSSVDITAAEPVEDISVPGVVGTAEPDDPVPVNPPTHHSDSLKFGSFGIPAPSTPSAAAQVSPGRVLIPAVVDQVQEQALAVLQALKVVETGVEAGEMCSRREYARWLINASNVLARSSSRKVFPAMYIENITDLAFDDVSPEDPDFPFIQGLAEAGLISSKLTLEDPLTDGSGPVLFAPDAPLSRQDLISWKLALEGGTQAVDKKTLQERSGFIDIDRIHEDAWPAIYADLAAGDDSIIATAFGYTRRFHPSKPATKAQAAVALVLGESAAVVADESARLQAEKIADQAVQEQLELEARALLEVDAALKEMLDLEVEGRLQAEASAEALKSQLDTINSERENESLALLKERAAIDSDKQVLAEYRRQLEEELSTLATLRAELALEREREGAARVEVEQGREDVRKTKNELEVEKQALTLARQWAEEEARNARAHAKVLEEVRKRWENQGIEVSVDGKIAEDNIPEQAWTYAEADAGTVSQTPRAVSGSEESDSTGPAGVVQKMTASAVNFVQNGTTNLLELVRKVVQALRNTLAELRAQAANKLSSVVHATENARDSSVSYVRQKAQDLREGTLSGVTGVSATVTQGTRKVADALKEEAAKIAQKFKTT